MPKRVGLYIHIPFCKRKCAYCDFNSFENKENLVEAYIESLCKEIELSKPKEKSAASSIFIGGGTPSLIDARYIKKILYRIQEYYYIDKDCEISIESNPGTLDCYKLKAYINAGVNRLSIGLQSGQDKHLKTLGRIHNYQMFEESYLTARNAGFGNINIDLIFGIPGQSVEEWNETLKKIVHLQPEHLSCYSLKIEAGTLFGRLYNNDCAKKTAMLPELPTEDEEREMYHSAITYLEENGYKHYEISNFCREGFECKHNIIYWKCDEYLGFGAGSHSYYDDKRFRNLLRVEKYIDSLTENRLPRTDFKKIYSKESIAEYVVLGLRMIDGIDTQQFNNKFNQDFEVIFKEQIEKLVKKKLLKKIDKTYCLTKYGLDFANQVMVEFV